MESVRFVGPMAPATKRRRPSCFCGDQRGLAGKARAVAVQIVDDLLHAVIGLGDRGAGEGVGLDDVGAGAEIVEVDVAHRVGLRQDQKVVVALDVLLPVLEPLATEILFGEARALELRSHRAVEHEDALGGASRSALRRRRHWRERE